MENKPYMTKEGWRRPLDLERHHRESGWNYRGKGVYHITLTVAERYPLFGCLEGDNPDCARVRLNDYGMKVLERLDDTPRLYGEKGFALKILASQIMPDHIHLAIQVIEPIPQSIGQVVRGFKSACTAIYKREYYCPKDGTKMDGEENCRNDATKVDGGGENPMHFSRIFTRTGSIWEQRPEHYHERILHPTSNLSDMIAYIKDNPRRLAMKRANPGLFRIREEIESRGVKMRGLGNRFLLDWPEKEALHCSRALTKEEISAKKEECLTKAKEGTIYICAAISEGEKHICRALREAGYRLIIILVEGFPREEDPHYRYYKPRGVYFETCSKGQLLLIEPDAEELEKPEIEAQVTAKAGNLPHECKRYRFLAMNGIAEKIAGDCCPNDGTKVDGEVELSQ